MAPCSNSFCNDWPLSPTKSSRSLRKGLTSRLAILTSLPFTRWHREGGAGGFLSGEAVGDSNAPFFFGWRSWPTGNNETTWLWGNWIFLGATGKSSWGECHDFAFLQLLLVDARMYVVSGYDRLTPTISIPFAKLCCNTFSADPVY